MMNSTQLSQPVVARSGASVHSREEDEYSQQHDDNPLEVSSTISKQPTPAATPNHTGEDEPPSFAVHEHPDEPPPPYEDLHADAPQIAAIEYSCENSPQLVVSPQFEFPAAAATGSLASVLDNNSVQSDGGSSLPSQNPTLVPAPLNVPLRPRSFEGSESQGSSVPPSTFSSAKAREAGFEIQTPRSPKRSESTTSFPSITLLSSTEPLKHTREPGKLKAYLIPFPKPRLKGIRVEDVPDRFFLYTPPLPPLSKPAPGEKESQWHKTRRTWQEDTRKALVENASLATWKGMKAKSTLLIGKGMDLTRSSNVEFLDRAAEGTITSTAEEVDAQESVELATSTTPRPSVSRSQSQSESQISIPVEPDANPLSPPLSKPSDNQTEKTTVAKPKALEELTLIYPPSLPLAPDTIRSEFIEALFRTRDKSRKEAMIASALFPVAAAVDASLLITFGGFTEVSGAWAYTSIRGVKTSKKLTEGLARSEEEKAALAHVHEDNEDNTEIRGCTCGHHENSFGHPEIVPKDDKKEKDKGKGKKKAKKGIDLRMQQSNHLEILRRYLELACLKRDFNMFPQIEEAAGDANNQTVLEAIGWEPTRRQGRDLEVEVKNKVVESLTPEQDEQWQRKEAREDVSRLFKKAATEWVAWCKLFQKDSEAALKR